MIPRKGWGRPLFSALCFASVALITLGYGHPFLSLIAFWCLGGCMVMTAWINPYAGLLLTAGLVGGVWGLDWGKGHLPSLALALPLIQVSAPGLVTGFAWGKLRGKWAIGTATLVTYGLYSLIWFALVGTLGAETITAFVSRTIETLQIGGLTPQQLSGAVNRMMIEMPSFLLYWSLLAVMQCYAAARLMGRYRLLAPGPITDWAQWGPLPVRYAAALLFLAFFDTLELVSGPAASVFYNLEKALQIGFHTSGFALLWAGTVRRRVTSFGFTAGLFRALLIVLFMTGYQWYTSILLYVGLFYSFSGLKKSLRSDRQ